MKIRITQKDPHSHAWFNNSVGGEFEVKETIPHPKHGDSYILSNSLAVNARYTELVVEQREEKRVMKVIEKGGE